MSCKPFKILDRRDKMPRLGIEWSGVKEWGKGFGGVLLGLAAACLLAGCQGGPSPKTPPSGRPGAGEVVRQLGCLAAEIVAQRCVVGIETSADRCLEAQVIARVCAAARRFEVAPGTGAGGVLSDRETWECARRSAEAVAAGEEPEECEQGAPATLTTAGAPPAAGAGYAPRSRTVFYRAIPGGPERTAIGDPSADPWAVACAAKTGAELAACLRSRFLDSNPAVCAEYARAFGVDTCGTPAGGWTRGPSNERWGSALQALNYFCENDPAVIGSTGRAGGWDCESTAVEWSRLGAFGGEAIVTEWQRRTNPVVLCPNGRIDPGETCRTCPADVGSCPPPPPPPPTDPRLDCSGLRLPPPGAPQFVATRAGTNSTGISGYELLECRGGSLPTPEPLPVPRPALSATTRATLAAVCGWIRSDQPTRRRKCAAAVSEVLGLDAIVSLAGGEGGEGGEVQP